MSGLVDFPAIRQPLMAVGFQVVSDILTVAPHLGLENKEGVLCDFVT
jgi:hypothetical protein